MKEQTKPSEEQKKGKLKQKWEKSSYLKDAPFFHARISIEMDFELFFGVVLVTREVLVEPLFHENTEGRGDEGDDETQRPQSIDRDSESRTSEGWGSGDG